MLLEESVCLGAGAPSINPLPNNPDLNDLWKKKSFENIAEKGENAGNQKGENVGNQHFILFAQCFPVHQGKNSLFESFVISRLGMPSVWTEPNFTARVAQS